MTTLTTLAATCARCNAPDIRTYSDWRGDGFHVRPGERPQRIEHQGGYTFAYYCGCQTDRPAPREAITSQEIQRTRGKPETQERRQINETKARRIEAGLEPTLATRGAVRLSAKCAHGKPLGECAEPVKQKPTHNCDTERHYQGKTCADVYADWLKAIKPAKLTAPGYKAPTPYWLDLACTRTKQLAVVATDYRFVFGSENPWSKWLVNYVNAQKQPEEVAA